MNEPSQEERYQLTRKHIKKRTKVIKCEPTVNSQCSEEINTAWLPCYLPLQTECISQLTHSSDV